MITCPYCETPVMAWWRTVLHVGCPAAAHVERIRQNDRLFGVDVSRETSPAHRERMDAMTDRIGRMLTHGT